MILCTSGSYLAFCENKLEEKTECKTILIQVSVKAVLLIGART